MASVFINLTLCFTLLPIVCAPTALQLLKSEVVRIKDQTFNFNPDRRIQFPYFQVQNALPILYYMGLAFLGLVFVNHIASASSFPSPTTGSPSHSASSSSSSLTVSPVSATSIVSQLFPHIQPSRMARILESFGIIEREYVLKLGETFEALITDGRLTTPVEVPYSTSYQRLLIDRCSAYYKLQALKSHPLKNALYVMLTPESRIPDRRIGEPAESPEPRPKPFHPDPESKRGKHSSLTSRSYQRPQLMSRSFSCPILYGHTPHEQSCDAPASANPSAQYSEKIYHQTRQPGQLGQPAPSLNTPIGEFPAVVGGATSRRNSDDDDVSSTISTNSSSQYTYYTSTT